MNYHWQRRPRLLVIRKDPKTSQTEFAALVRGFKDGPVLQVPGGGLKHETDEACLQREVLEETGLTIYPEQLVLANTYSTIIEITRGGKNRMITLTLPFYFTTKFSGTLRLAEPEKFLFAGWTTRAMLPELMYTYNARIANGLYETLDLLEIK